jgi:uncharacterized membrane protein
VNFTDGLFGDFWAYGAFFPYVLLLLWAVRTAPWKRLTDNDQMHAWMGAIVVLTMMWSLKAGAKPGLHLHFLGAAAFTLMFGRQLAIIGFSIVLAAVTFNAGLKGIAGWQAYALNAWAFIVVPVFVAHWVWRLVENYLPPNIFVFFFVAAFFGGALTVISSGLFGSALFWGAGIYNVDMLVSDYLLFHILLGFAEAWLNGAAITLMVVYLPRWVGSFDDRRYLWQKKEPRR